MASIEGVRPPDHIYKGQPYWDVREDDGRTYMASFCAECGCPFEIYKPHRVVDQPWWPSRRCHACAKPGVRVSKPIPKRSLFTIEE
jgi:hypothetical protein